MIKKFFFLFLEKIFTALKDCEHNTAVNEINNNEGKRFEQEPSLFKVILIQLYIKNR